MEQDTIQSLVRKAEQNYVSGTTTLSKYVQHSMFETIERIDAYLNSKHISGSKDSLGRDKPFFNIVTAAVNIWYRATDIDRKDIRIKATKSSEEILAFLATVHLRNWMKKTQFGVFLNQWGRALSRYGSAVVKFVEKDGTLYASVVPWNRIIVDSVDFKNNIKIEKLYLTPAQLRSHPEYDQEQVENLIANAQGGRETLDKQKKDTLSGYIELYEVHGELPLLYLTGRDSDAKIYRQQMHVVSFIEAKAGTYEDFSLYKGKEKKDPYMITHLIEEDGRTLSIGAVEHLFEAQWMQNHSIKTMKDTLDLASRLIFQTSDGNFIGRNVLKAVETGDILITKINEPLTQLNNSKQDITSLQNFANQWRVLAQELTSTPDALRGNTMPSGTPYSLGTLLAQNAGSLFEIMTENKGLAIEEMLRVHVIPHLKTKLNNADEVAATLESHDLTKIDSIFVPKEAIRQYNRSAIDTMLSGNIPSPYQPDLAEQGVKDQLATQGATRFFTTDDAKKTNWNELFKDFEWECEVEVTNESVDKQAVLTTLSSMLQTAVNNPELYKLISSKIMEVTGVISPIEVKTATAQPMAQQPAPPIGG